MTYATYTARPVQSAAGAMLGLLERMFTETPRRRTYVDARDLPDHLKRDIGFMDGHKPSGSIR